MPPAIFVQRFQTARVLLTATRRNICLVEGAFSFCLFDKIHNEVTQYSSKYRIPLEFGSTIRDPNSANQGFVGWAKPARSDGVPTIRWIRENMVGTAASRALAHPTKNINTPSG
jgi:hypothetical protein